MRAMSLLFTGSMTTQIPAQVEEEIQTNFLDDSCSVIGWHIVSGKNMPSSGLMD
jgi:hypothetical protein